MRAQLRHALDAFSMGRDPLAVAAEVGNLFGFAVLAWAALCLFLALEPLP